MFWTVVRGLVSIRVKNIMFLNVLDSCKGPGILEPGPETLEPGPETLEPNGSEIWSLMGVV